MIHPTIRLVAAAVRDGCPDDVAPTVVSAVLRATGSELAQRNVSPDLPYRWADELDESAQAATAVTTAAVRANNVLTQHN